MSDYLTTPPTTQELIAWSERKKRDPRTNEKIDKKSDVYKLLKKALKNLYKTDSSEAPPDTRTLETVDYGVAGIDSLSEIDLADPHGRKKQEAKEAEKKEESLYRMNGRPITYNDTTMVYYKNMRKRKMDVISTVVSKEDRFLFPFPWMWDPYTGERLTDKEGNWIPDPYGPLYVDVHHLIKNFYMFRTNYLFVEGHDGWEGHYGDGVGASKNFVTDKGPHPEWDLFRFPVTDCYLTADHNPQYVTMGPRLTRSELEEIYTLARQSVHRYRQWHRHNLPNILTMADQYYLAINPEPPIVCDSGASESKKAELRGIANREAVNVLRNMR